MIYDIFAFFLSLLFIIYYTNITVRIIIIEEIQMDNM